MEFKDYYKILGVEPDADAKDIKAAYRKLARKTHPDLNPGKESEDAFKAIAEAYEVLKNKDRRAEYDELREHRSRQSSGGFEPPPGWSSRARSDAPDYNDDFSDFFSSIFGGASRGRGGQGPSNEDFGIRGQDLEIDMPVFLEETLTDQQKPLRYEIPVRDGSGANTIKKSLKVKIPAGVADGARIRLKGQGAPGMGSSPAGDLYLHVRLVPHPLFDVQGHDLYLALPLSPWEAALGTKVTVPTLDGKISLTIKPGSQAGQKLRVKGKGLPRGTGRGDLYAQVKIVMPANTDSAAKQAWEQLAANQTFDPRAEWENE